ncbi:MAG: FecR family protein [Dehalococcoidales bacterium]|nr:FecR family protein [Dehalococcoidales bacterium]
MILRRWRTLATLFSIIVMLFVFPGCASKDQSVTILSVASGSISIAKPGSTKLANGVAGMTLGPGDIIQAGDNSTAVITFFDGSTIELKADTHIEVISLDTASSGSTTILLKQQLGKTISRVTKLVDSKSRYEIETPAAAATVRGSVMLVDVAPDGTTHVGNQEGKISVIAQGVEVIIPEWNISTVLPGAPPGEPQPISEQMRDPREDVFDRNGNPVNGYEYLDIASVSASFENGHHVFTVVVNGLVPGAVEAPSILEWDIMVDSDNDVSTGWQSPLLFNDIGVDYYVSLSLYGSKFSVNAQEITKRPEPYSKNLKYSTSESAVEISFTPGTIGNTSDFRYIVLTRKYGKIADANTLVSADKLPNQGHLAYASTGR